MLWENMANADSVVITRSDISGVTIIATSNGKNELVDPLKLTWHIMEFTEVDKEERLTLKEISQQLLRLGYKSVLYVWEETPLEGTIYQYGNYEDRSWVIHGTTKGFA